MSTFFDNDNNKNDMGKLIHVGAGSGNDLNDYLAQNFSEILFLEPIPKVFKQLESKITKLNKISAECSISALNVALYSTTNTNKEKLFYITQPTRYSGFHKADKLKTLFQNLKTEQEIKVNTLSFTDLIKTSRLNKNKKNAIVFQINGAEYDVLAKAEPADLMLFSSIVIQQVKNNYFAQPKAETDLTTLMKAKGFQLVTEAYNDVVYTSLVFRKDESIIKLKALNEKHSTQAAYIVELESRLKASNEEKIKKTAKAAEEAQIQTKLLTDLEHQLKTTTDAKFSESTKALEQNKKQSARITELENQLKTTNDAKLSEITKALEQNKKQSARITDLEQSAAQLVALQAKHTELAETQKNKDTQIAELTKQRNDQTKLVQEKLQQTAALTVGYEDKIKQLNEAIIGLQTSLLKAQEHINEKLESSNANLLKSTTEHMTKIQKSLNWRMDKGFLNTVKQVESFIGVQSYLETGQLAMEYHGWPISSDVALFLLGKVEKNNYDLIIEFGSGTSTQLFAKAINNQLKDQHGKHIDEDLALIGSDKGGSFARSALHRELPNRIVTFEHNKKYHNKTMAELEANKLSHLVDLVHAPLIEMKIENDDYLYYSCEHKLAQLATIYLERTVKILVLIDGPPGATGPLARLPAVPLLLNYLGKHQLDIVLDDYKRQEEIETVERWKRQFEKRSLVYDEEIVPCEKGAFFCRINP
jgi:FkbM family methyltransferase